MTTVIRKHMMVSAEMDLKPFMNLMVVLIPMLLLSAEFAKVAVVDITLPEGRGVTPQGNPASGQRETTHLNLTALLTDSAVTLAAKGGFLPSIPYREFHRYKARDDQADFTVEYVPGKKVLHPQSSREMSPQERDEILLYVCNDDRSIVQSLYSGYNEPVTDASGSALTKVAAGDTVFVGSVQRRITVVTAPQMFTLKPLSVYDELQNRLVKIRERYSDADDRDKIIIAAENGVIYDKIIQVMDKARAAHFPQISISKLRG